MLTPLPCLCLPFSSATGYEYICPLACMIFEHKIAMFYFIMLSYSASLPGSLLTNANLWLT